MMRKRKSVLVLVALVLGASLVLLLRPSSLDVRHLDPKRVAQLRMQLFDSETVDGYERVVNDPHAVVGLLALFQQADRTRGHKCASRAHFIFELTDGRTVETGVLPGHHAPFYEFRDKTGYYRIDRRRFLDAMAVAGVPENLLVRPGVDP
jgi:hypothetical protein